MLASKPITDILLAPSARSNDHAVFLGCRLLALFQYIVPTQYMHPSFDLLVVAVPQRHRRFPVDHGVFGINNKSRPSVIKGCEHTSPMATVGCSYFIVTHHQGMCRKMPSCLNTYAYSRWRIAFLITDTQLHHCHWCTWTPQVCCPLR